MNNKANVVINLIEDLLNSYSDYRVDNQLQPLKVSTESDVSVLLNDSQLIAQVLLSGIESVGQWAPQSLERHTFNVNVFGSGIDTREFNDIVYDIRKAITQLTYRDFNLGTELSKFEHPSVQFDLSASDNASLSIATAQLQFVLDIIFDYAVSNTDGITGEGFDWSIILGGNNE